MLTDKAIAQAKPKDKIYRLYDQHGLYLEVAPGGGRWWRLKYRWAGKEKRLSLGTYPLVTLKEARLRRDEARKSLDQGIEPAGKRRASAPREAGTTFEAVAREWWGKFLKPNGGKYPDEAMRRLEKRVFPHIGQLALERIDAPLVLSVLRRIEKSNAVETAYKVRSYISQTMRYGIACGLITHDPARDLAGALSPRKKKPMAAIIDPKEAGALMRAIDGYSGSFMVRCALQLQALTFVRPGELRPAEWAEFDFDGAEWRIPAEKMKMKRAHLVPLSRQALGVLRDLHAVTGHGPYLFPSMRSAARPMSDMTVNAALRALGYSRERMTGHGFRAMAASLLAEQGCWSVDAIERQLAHVERNKVRAAYHRSEHLEERRRMMQAWADYLDQLKSNPINPI